MSVCELARVIGVHHSQIVRYEQGSFRTINSSVQLLCNYLRIRHSRLAVARGTEQLITERFSALLDSIPGSAAAFATLFDLLEVSMQNKHPRKSNRQPFT